MKLKLSGLGTIFKKTVNGWNEDDPFRQSAAIAYYAVFSLPALLVLIINVAGFFFGKEAVTGEISKQVEGVMGKETAKQVSDIITKAGTVKAGIISSIIAIITIIFGATGVFVQLQKSLNQIWGVRQKPTKGLKMFKSRLFSFGLIVSIGFLLLVSLVVSSVLAALSDRLEGSFPDGIAALFFVLEFVISLVVIVALFALMFKVLPDVKMPWKNVMIGALLTGVLFMLGKYGLSFYFGKSDPGSAYGAAGSIVLILLWVSYSSMIVFFGAEFTKQYAVYHGSEIQPTEDAEKVPDVSSVEQEHIQKKEETEPVYLSDGHDRRKKSSKPEKEQALKNEHEIESEIDKLERRVEEDRGRIKDNLRPRNWFRRVGKMWKTKKD